MSKAPACGFCGRRDWSPLRLLLRAQRIIRSQRGVLKGLRADVAVAQAGWDHEKALRLDAEARAKRAVNNLDFLVAGRLEQYGAWMDGERPA